MSDPYFELVLQHEENIIRLYMAFSEKRPIMLFDVQESRIYAYPYDQFLADLTPQSQALLKEQYTQAIREGRMVVFVRDNKKRKLVSYSPPLTEPVRLRRKDGPI